MKEFDEAEMKHVKTIMKFFFEHKRTTSIDNIFLKWKLNKDKSIQSIQPSMGDLTFQFLMNNYKRITKYLDALMNVEAFSDKDINTAHKEFQNIYQHEAAGQEKLHSVSVVYNYHVDEEPTAPAKNATGANGVSRFHDDGQFDRVSYYWSNIVKKIENYKPKEDDYVEILDVKKALEGLDKKEKKRAYVPKFVETPDRFGYVVEGLTSPAKEYGSKVSASGAKTGRNRKLGSSCSEIKFRINSVEKTALSAERASSFNRDLKKGVYVSSLQSDFHKNMLYIKKSAGMSVTSSKFNTERKSSIGLLGLKNTYGSEDYKPNIAIQAFNPFEAQTPGHSTAIPLSKSGNNTERERGTASEQRKTHFLPSVAIQKVSSPHRRILSESITSKVQNIQLTSVEI
jgi:hypothetical protein